MKKIYKIFFYFIWIFFIFGFHHCVIFKNRLTKDYDTKVEIYQNGKKIEIQNQIAVIEKKPFEIRFRCKKYQHRFVKHNVEAALGAFLSKKIIDSIRVGDMMQATTCFGQYKILAIDQSGHYESLRFSDEGYHSLMYNSQSDRRSNLLEPLENGIYALEFPITQLYLEKEHQIEKTNLNIFYIALLIDKNLNQKIDSTELTKLQILFKS